MSKPIVIPHTMVVLRPRTIVVSSRIHRYDVYIGRPSKWGNPYSHIRDSLARYIVGSRVEAVEMYREWLPTQPQLIAALPELFGRRLGCPGCEPDNELCHGHVLAEMVDALPFEVVNAVP